MTSPGDEIIEDETETSEDNTSATGEATNQDDLAAEWESMVGDQENAAEAESGGSDASRVLNQDEVVISFLADRELIVSVMRLME